MNPMHEIIQDILAGREHITDFIIMYIKKTTELPAANTIKCTVVQKPFQFFFPEFFLDYMFVR
jgi:hypothetical protein